MLPGGVGRAVAEAAGVGAARLPRLAGRLPAVGRLPTAAGLRERRVQVARHLRRVVGPHLSGRALDRAIDATFASYARYWAESLRLPSLSAAEVEAAMSLRGMGHLHDARAAGRGVILALPHLGGWEWGGMWLAHSGVPVTVVVEALQPPELFEWFVAYRRGLGMDVLANGPDVGAACLRALRQGRVLCLLSDRVVGGTPGVEVEFFGERTHLPAGPVTLALRTGAPLLPAAVYFTGGGGHLAVVRPPVALDPGPGRLRQRITDGTEALAVELEGLIRRDPTQWHLMVPNWPSDGPPAARR